MGSAWRGRWDSLTLFTPRRYDGLPGLAFPGDPDGYPTRDEVIAYLERYAETFGLPVELGSAVRSLSQRDGTFVVDLGDRRIEADQVVVATGPFQVPSIPAFAAGLAPEVLQIHSAGYRRPPTAARRDASSSWAAATPATRSPRSCPRRTGSTSPWALARPRCRSGCSGATCSGG